MSLEQQPAATLPSSTGKRFTSYNESEVFESLDNAKTIFEFFVDSPPTLEEALKTAKIPNHDVVLAESMRQGKAAMKKLGQVISHLTNDEAGAIACYTLELGDQSLYKIANTAISSTRSNQGLNASIKFIYLLLSGLRKLQRYVPKPGEKLYRGIATKVPTTAEEANRHQHYAKGLTVTWWSFTSTTTNPEVLNNFLSDAPKTTLFTIGGEGLWGYDVHAFSNFFENEVLLEPEAKVMVTSVVRQGPSSLVIGVDLQPFDHLVLEDVIKIPKEPIPKKKQKLSSERNIPEGLKVKNLIYKGVEVLWNPVAGKGNVYQVFMKKVDLLNFPGETIYEGRESSCIVGNLEIGAEYEFWVRCKSGGAWGEWSKSVVEKVGPLNVKMAVNTLRMLSDEPGICGEVLIYMAFLLNKEENDRIEAGKSGAIDAILKVMEKHINDGVICCNGCQALWNITLNTNNQKEAGECGAIETIQEIMKIHINDKDICNIGCQALWNIATDRKSGAIEAILNAMKKHINDEYVCHHGCGALSNITSNAINQVKAGGCGVIEIVLDVMKTNIKNPGICYNGLGALGNITSNATNQARAGKSGAIEVLLNIFMTHISNVNVCQNLFKALGNIAEDAHNQKKAGKSGVIEAILKAIKWYVKYPDVCCNCCRALSNITLDANNQAKAGKLGAIEVILEIMNAHISNLDVCYNGCRALCNITTNVINQKKAGNSEIIETILNAIKEHVENSDMCLQGIGTLNNIMMDASNQAKAGECGAIKVISDAMKKHTLDVNVCRSGCGALGNITMDANNQKKAGKSGAIEAILSAMKTHISNADICHHGCRALNNITLDFSSKAKAGGCGAIEVILNATITHKGNPDICEQGCKALQNILVNPAGQNSKK